MIKQEPAKVLEAKCDSCGANMMVVEHWHEDGDPSKPEQTSASVEYGIVQGHFGYCSKGLDDCNERFHICEDCFLKVAKFLQLDIFGYCPGEAGWEMECKIHPGRIYKDCCGPKRGFGASTP